MTAASKHSASPGGPTKGDLEQYLRRSDRHLLQTQKQLEELQADVSRLKTLVENSIAAENKRSETILAALRRPEVMPAAEARVSIRGRILPIGFLTEVLGFRSDNSIRRKINEGTVKRASPPMWARRDAIWIDTESLPQDWKLLLEKERAELVDQEKEAPPANCASVRLEPQTSSR